MSDNTSIICRICEELREETLVNITLPENKGLIVEFLACADVSYNINDRLPKYFCHQCVSMLNDAYYFKGQCERTEKKLLQLLCTATEIKTLDESNVNPFEFIKSEYLIDTKIQNETMDNMEPIETINENNVSDFDQSVLLKEESSEADLLDNKPRLSVSKKSVKCYECEQKFKSKRQLRFHKQLKQCTNINLDCDVCHISFKCKSKFERHRFTHATSNTYTCDICNKLFHQKKNLIFHMKVHGHGCDTPFKCEHCPKQYSTAHGLKLHNIFGHTIDRTSKKTGDKTYQCDYCRKKFTSSNRLKQHILLHKESLDSHTLKHQTNNFKPKNYICTICGHSFISSVSLNNHMVIHSDERPYSCNLCDSKFKLKSHLTNHMHIHNDEKPYNCLECDRAFTKKDALNRHKTTHNNDRPYECPICGEKFRSPVTIAHMTRHTGEKPYNCDHCEKSFISYHKLKRHLRSHTGIKPYACTLCNIGFVKVQIFEKHLGYHIGNESYKGTIDPRSGYHPIYEKYVSCTWCCGGFLTMRSLKFHQTKHSGGKSFTCQICGQGFSTTNGLEDHVTVYHQNVVVQ